MIHFFLLLSLLAFLTGAPLDPIYIDYLFYAFRQTMNDNNSSFDDYSPFWQSVFESGGLLCGKR